VLSHKALILSPKIAECQHLASFLKEKAFESHFALDDLDAMCQIKETGYDLIVCDRNCDQLLIEDIKKHAPKSHLLLLDMLSRSHENSLSEACQQIVSQRDDLIAKSPIMQKLLADALKIANSHANVFISGESGTGKEVIAKFIHDHSPRSKHPFIKVNCAALPETLIEAEFFGHEKGAFTGAIKRHIGRFERADLGSLLLDEITEVPLSLQAKLLRAVQEGEFERLGGMNPINVNVRLISTSNRNMEEAMEKGLFRKDLYYRLNVVPLHLPPLRERKEDIIPLAEHFLTRACTKNHKGAKSLSKAAKERLISYDFPGNIRELSNIIEHAVVLDRGPIIQAEDLPIKQRVKHYLPQMAHSMTLEELERWFIEKTLKECKHNKTHTAKALGIHVRTLRNKLMRYEAQDRDR